MKTEPDYAFTGNLPYPWQRIPSKYIKDET